jgi:glycosyltransferase involved in cell wall biosynthesis
MKIAFIGQKGIPAHVGGVERYVEELAVRLAAFGHEVIVYTRPNYTPKELGSYKGVQLISLPSIGTKHLDAISHTLFASLDVLRRGVDVVHYQSIGPALLAWIPKLFGRRLKVVSTLQCRDYEHQKWGAFARLMLKLGERSMCRFSDELIVATKSIANHVKDKYGITAPVIPNGATIPTQESGVAALSAWQLNKNGYILAVARLIKHKGLDYLVEAYGNLQTDKKLVIVGDGAFTDDYVAELKARAAKNENIIFTGTQQGETLAALFDNAYLFVHPSESEGLSLALLEAMARGKAVVVSDIAENIEAIGKAGAAFSNKDVNDLTRVLNNLLADFDLSDRLGSAARERAKQLYDWEIISEKTAEVYLASLSARSLGAKLRNLLTQVSRIIPLF